MQTLNKEIMIMSFNNISFNSEKRGKQDFSYYTELLAKDLEELEATGKLGENNNFESKFIDKVMTIYHRQINCASSMITGPANFNIKRNQKKWDSRDKAENDFNHWREKYIKAVNRVRTLSPEAEIEAAIKRLDFLIANKAMTKKEHEESEINAVYNVTLKIREIKKKIAVMKSRIEAKENFGVKLFNGGSIYIDNDRVIIKHDEKPDKGVIDAIKKNGFRYSPKFLSWVRKHTMRARIDAEYLFNNVFGGEVKA